MTSLQKRKSLTSSLQVSVLKLLKLFAFRDMKTLSDAGVIVFPAATVHFKSAGLCSIEKLICCLFTLAHIRPVHMNGVCVCVCFQVWYRDLFKCRNSFSFSSLLVYCKSALLFNMFHVLLLCNSPECEMCCLTLPWNESVLVDVLLQYGLSPCARLKYSECEETFPLLHTELNSGAPLLFIFSALVQHSKHPTQHPNSWVCLHLNRLNQWGSAVGL